MTNEAWTASANARIDWPTLLDEIAYMLGDPLPENAELRVPVSVHRLADHLQVARGTLRGWQDGAEPRHGDGEVIIGHWCRLTGKARTFVPVDRYVLSAAKVATVKRGTDKPRASAGAALHAVCVRWNG
jgi:hypothetical protein